MIYVFLLMTVGYVGWFGGDYARPEYSAPLVESVPRALVEPDVVAPLLEPAEAPSAESAVDEAVPEIAPSAKSGVRKAAPVPEARPQTELLPSAAGGKKQEMSGN